jgi:hypothetical protein
VTIRELPISKAMAGVNMRLKRAASVNCIGTRRPNGPTC